MSLTPNDTKAPANKSGRVYFIDARYRLLSVNPDGSDLKVFDGRDWTRA
jgi:hypothetical protein